MDGVRPGRPSRRDVSVSGDWCMAEPMMIDLKALLIEREDCDAGTVQQLRNALAQGGNQYRTLRDVTEIIKKKLEAGHRRRRQALAPETRHRLVLPRLHGPGRRASQAGRRRAGQLLSRPRPGLAPGLRRGAQGVREGGKGRLHRQPGAACSGPASTARRANCRQARALLGQARTAEQPQRRVSFPAGELLPRRRRTSKTPSSTWKRPSSWTPATPTPCSSWPTPTTWPATTTKPSSSTNAASSIRRSTSAR